MMLVAILVVNIGNTNLTKCTDGRPSLDRQWMECYAQLVGTVLSLWEASALDAADGAEVPATFINLADASIKMVRSLVYSLWKPLIPLPSAP